VRETDKNQTALDSSFLGAALTYFASTYNLIYKVPEINERVARTFDNYAGNFSGSYTIYFISRFLLKDHSLSPMESAILAFAISNGAEAHQATYGKGDILDVALNTLGIGLALGVDHLTKRGIERWRTRKGIFF
jgi:glycopeptide antibiotics resistance protein